MIRAKAHGRFDLSASRMYQFEIQAVRCGTILFDLSIGMVIAILLADPANGG